MKSWRARVTAMTTAFGLGVAGLSPSVALATPYAVGAPQEEVDAIVAEAVEKFQAKEYDEAAALFEQAYELSPEPNYLFNIGRVYEQAGNIEKAVEFYARFVKEPEVELGAREVAVERLRVLRGVLEETAPKPPPEEDPDDGVGDPTESDDPPPDDAPPDDTTDEPKKPNPLRITGFVLLGVGVGAVATGGALGGVALGHENDLNTLNTLETRDDAVTKGKRSALIADILFGVGGAMLVTGVVLVAVSYAGKNKSRRAAVAPTLTRRGAGIAAEVRF